MDSHKIAENFLAEAEQNLNMNRSRTESDGKDQIKYQNSCIQNLIYAAQKKEIGSCFGS